VHVSMRHGTVMSLRDTASGRLFAALLPSKEVDAVWQASDGPRDADFEAELARIRSQGLAWVAGTAVPGVSAAAVPVFEGNGQITLSLTVIGPAATMDRAPGGPICTALQQAAAALSVQLGWRSGHR
jgi:DNA-binding IclR family transcriptional regulator